MYDRVPAVTVTFHDPPVPVVSRIAVLAKSDTPPPPLIDQPRSSYHSLCGSLYTGCGAGICGGGRAGCWGGQATLSSPGFGGHVPSPSSGSDGAGDGAGDGACASASPPAP